MGLAMARPKIGLSLNVPDGGGVKAYVAAMDVQKRLGLTGGALSVKWDEYEAQHGKPLTDGLSAAAYMRQEVLLTISTIDTVNRRLPADLAQLPFDDPKVEARFDSVLADVAAKAGGKVRWISLGNEANVYFMAHPAELKPYQAFLAHGRQVLHRLIPGCQVGVTVTCMDAITDPKVATRLQEGMDLSIFTYYPLTAFSVLPISAVPQHFSFMRRAAGNRPLFLQEIGYPSSSLNGSSPQKQAEFVAKVFEQIALAGDSIKLACFFLQCDFSAATVNQLTGYYGISGTSPGTDKFRGFLGSLGLCDPLGKPKPAWDVFEKECARIKSQLD